MIRTLRAKQISTGQWFPRLATGDKPAAEFAAELAAAYPVPVADIQVFVGTVADEAARQAMVVELVAGLHQGAPVLAPVAPPVLPASPLRTAIATVLADPTVPATVKAVFAALRGTVA